MQRNGIFWILTAFVVGGAGYLIANYFSTPNESTSGPSLEKTSTTVSRETIKPTKRSTKNLNLNKKNNIKPETDEDAPSDVLSEKEKDNLENQFQAFRDEQRKQWQEIFGEDREKMRAVIRAAIDNHPEFSEMFRRSRELRDNWANTSDAEKPKVLAELSELRQKGLIIINSEIEKYTNTPATPPPADQAPATSPSPGNPTENTTPSEPEKPSEPAVIM